MRELLTRLPPGGSPIPKSALLRLLRDDLPAETVRDQLSQRFDRKKITLHASGREAMRIAFQALVVATGRNEVAVPAYSCFSIAAAAVAAGMRVHLVDITENGQLDPAALARQPMDQIAAVVVANLFGIPEPIDEILAIARAADAAVIDDAAQTLGGECPTGQVGARGDLGILSFGRGKPLSALGGGAIIWSESFSENAAQDLGDTANRWAALIRAGAYNTARIPLVLRTLAAIPRLGIGETVYDSAFPQGSMPGAAAALAAALLPELDEENGTRALRAQRLAQQISTNSDFVPLLVRPGNRGAYPRLGVLAPSARQRDTALKALAWLGATRMYPTPLGSLADLQRHLAAQAECPGAQQFSERLLTLPTHSGMTSAMMANLVGVLGRA